ncbi:MAG: nucleotidyltransferase domain-containing protein [Candidatus Hydrothermarchaeales archaeon]
MLTENNKFKVLRQFFIRPTKEYYIREISRIVGLSPPGVMKILSGLEKERLIIKRKNAVTTNYKANLKNRDFIALKRSYNLYSIHKSGLLDLLIEFYDTPEAIVLFGSYAAAEDLEKSDVDIAVVTSKDEYPPLEKFEEEIFRKINIHLVKNVEKAEKEFINILANGVVLSGYLEVV